MAQVAAVVEVLAASGLPHDHDLVAITDITVIETWVGQPVTA